MEAEIIYPAEEEITVEEDQTDPFMSYIPEEEEDSTVESMPVYESEKTETVPVLRKRKRKRHRKKAGTYTLNELAEAEHKETAIEEAVLSEEPVSEKEEVINNQEVSAEVPQEQPVETAKAEKETVKEEGKAFNLEDYDLSLLDAFNKTYTLKDAEKEEVDAFMDKLEIKL